jgi:16S rRNA (uracil1498-N3)-methyltransferase
MSDRRFHHPELNTSPVELDHEQAAHARRSLRLRVGDMVELFDGLGTIATGRIIRCDQVTRIEIVERRQLPRPTPWIDLAVAIPKGSRADVLVEKASELGADRLIPLISHRSVVDPGDNKLDRFARLATESAKQCGRPHFMTIEPPTSLERFLKSANHDRRLIADEALAHEGAAANPASVQDLLNDLKGVKRLAILIGPEGGWTDQEKSAAKTAGFHSVGLGPYVLRIETAALAAVAIARRSS